MTGNSENVELLDRTRVISQELGYVSTNESYSFGRTTLIVVFVGDLQYVDIGPGPNQHTWGAALFSKVRGRSSPDPDVTD